MLNVGRKPAVASDLLQEGKANPKPPCRGEMFVFIAHIKMRCSVDQLCGTFTVVIKPELYCFNLSRALPMFVQ